MTIVLPETFVERLRLLYPETIDLILRSYDVDRKPTIRINTLIIGELECKDCLQKLGFELEKVAQLSLGYRVLNRSKRDLTDTEEYKKGWFYIQSLSSMIPVQVIEGELLGKQLETLQVLDMCAAPGSKTTQLAGVMQNKGHIIANDASRQRIYQLASNLKMCGVKNVQTLLYKGEFLWKKFGPVFDIVLLDAPCSGEGRFDHKDPGSYEDWSLKKVERLSQLQKQLIFSAVMCLKPGGLLVYSTCTMSPEENEEIVDFMLKKFEGAVDIEEMFFENDRFGLGKTNWRGLEFDVRMEKTIRIIPDEIWDGFYVAKIRRAG